MGGEFGCQAPTVWQNAEEEEKGQGCGIEMILVHEQQEHKPISACGPPRIYFAAPLVCMTYFHQNKHSIT